MPASRSGREWSKADVKKLRQFAKRRVSSSVAAKKLGRSPGATRFKAMVEGIRFRRLRVSA